MGNLHRLAACSAACVRIEVGEQQQQQQQHEWQQSPMAACEPLHFERVCVRCERVKRERERERARASEARIDTPAPATIVPSAPPFCIQAWFQGNRQQKHSARSALTDRPYAAEYWLC